METEDIPTQEDTPTQDLSLLDDLDWRDLLNEPISRLHNAHEQLGEAMEVKANALLMVLSNRASKLPQVRSALQRAGYPSEYYRYSSYQGMEMVRSAKGRTVFLTCVDSDGERSVVQIPEEIFDAGPEGYSTWLDTLLERERKASMEEGEKVRRDREEKERAEYERLKKIFEPEDSPSST